jgi:hypothetical protein
MQGGVGRAREGGIDGDHLDRTPDRDQRERAAPSGHTTVRYADGCEKDWLE